MNGINWICGPWVLLLTLATLLGSVSPNFNLLMDREEVHKLLGKCQDFVS